MLNKNNKTENLISLPVKILSLFTMVLLFNWLHELISYRSNNDIVFYNYSKEWLILIILSLLILISFVIINYQFWIKSIKSPNNLFLCTFAKVRSKIWLIIIFLILNSLGTFLITLFHDNLKEKGLLNFNNQVLLIGLFINIILILIYSNKYDKTFGKNRLIKNIFCLIIFIIIIVISIIMAIHNGIFWQGMIADESLDVYSSYTIANGAPPYSEYIILHPPMAYVPTAVFIFLGNLLSIDTLISARIGKLIIFLIIILLTYFLTLKITKNKFLSLLGSVMIGWNAVFTLISYNSPTKLYVVLFNIIVIILIQNNKWFWVGVTTILLVLSWGGAILYFALPITVLILGKWKESKKKLENLFLGLIVALIFLLLYLVFTETLDLFISQYVISTFDLIKGIFVQSDYTYASTQNVGLLVKLSTLSSIDKMALFLSILSFLIIINDEIRSFDDFKRVRFILSDQIKGPILINFLLIIVISILDFQSFLDLIPIVFPASMLIIIILDLHIFNNDTDIEIFVKSFLLLIVISFARFMHPIKSNLTLLEAQKVSAEWMNNFIADEEILYLGHLGQLILQDQMNSSRIIHLGPKTMTALESEGLKIEDYIEEIYNKDIDYIFVDNRNVALNYLDALFVELKQNYDFVSNTSSRGEFGGIYYKPENTIGQAFSYGLILSSQNPDLTKADLLLLNDQPNAAIAYYVDSVKSNWRTVNYCQLRIGEIRYLSGKQDIAYDNFKNVTNIGPYREIGSLALGTFYQSLGQIDKANDYYSKVFISELPDSFQFRGPKVFSPIELLDSGYEFNQVIDNGYNLTSYNFEIIDDQNSLLTLWWFVPDNRTPSEKMIIIQAIDKVGEPISDEIINFQTYFYPQLGVRWSYFLSNIDVNKIYGFKIGFYNKEGHIEFGDPISIEDRSQFFNKELIQNPTNNKENDELEEEVNNSHALTLIASTTPTKSPTATSLNILDSNKTSKETPTPTLPITITLTPTKIANYFDDFSYSLLRYNNYCGTGFLLFEIKSDSNIPIDSMILKSKSFEVSLNEFVNEACYIIDDLLVYKQFSNDPLVLEQENKTLLYCDLPYFIYLRAWHGRLFLEENEVFNFEFLYK